jgi:hypothetical protein
MLACYADAGEPVASLRGKPDCDPFYSECSNIVQIYTTTEVDRAIRSAVEHLRSKYDRELSDLKATVAAQSQQIAELRGRAALR